MRSSDETFKALADPTRREVLRLLGDGEMTAGQIADHFAIGRPTLSHHLAVLKEADLVHCRREGQTLWYALNTSVLQGVVAWALDVSDRVGKKGASSKRRPT
ncbi:MAG: winged helix-turn-helix transcriptional regulator [Betaproteobacteria bacterium]|nr:winged helix-turn-helix transcriptional regulator [Betaproteobacteria bacterium]